MAMRSAAALIGIAKPRPSALPAIAVLMPMTAPDGVEQRAAAVAGVDRGVGLDEAGERGPGGRSARPATVIVRPRRGDDPLRHGLGVRPERAADRDRGLADLDARRSRRCVAAVRPVASILIRARSLSVGLLDDRRPGTSVPSLERDAQRWAALDDVAVGEDVAVGREDDRRSRRRVVGWPNGENRSVAMPSAVIVTHRLLGGRDDRGQVRGGEVVLPVLVVARGPSSGCRRGRRSRGRGAPTRAAVPPEASTAARTLRRRRCCRARGSCRAASGAALRPGRRRGVTGSVAVAAGDGPRGAAGSKRGGNAGAGGAAGAEPVAAWAGAGGGAKTGR